MVVIEAIKKIVEINKFIEVSFVSFTINLMPTIMTLKRFNISTSSKQVFDIRN